MTKRAFGYFFDWIYPFLNDDDSSSVSAQHMEPRFVGVVHRAIEAWHRDYAVMSSLMKFLVEFFTNKSQRLNFDISSANGILMFREASKAAVQYGMGDVVYLMAHLKGRHLMSNSIAATTGDLYASKYKGITSILNILRVVFAGRYVSFGACQLYGDVALEEAYRLILDLFSYLPLRDAVV